MKTIQYVCERCGHTESRTILGRPLPEAEGEARDFCAVGVFAAIKATVDDEGLPPVPTVEDLLRTLARDEATEVVSEHESDTPHAV